MDSTTLAALAQEVPTEGLLSALRVGVPDVALQRLDPCVFSYLLRLLEGQTSKESYTDDATVVETLATYLVEFECFPSEAAATEAAKRVVSAMDVAKLTQRPPAEAPQQKLAAPMTMGRQYEDTLKKAGGASGAAGAKVTVNTNDTWTWESKASEAKEQKRRKKEEEKNAELRSEYEEFLRQRGLAQAAHTVVKMHDKAAHQAASGQKFTGDIRSHGINIKMGKSSLVEDSDLILLTGHRYGLVGRNGAGKTTLLRALSEGELEGVSPFIQIVHVEQEIGGDNMTPLECVLSADVERSNLLKEEQELLNENSDNASARLSAIYERLDFIDAHSAESRAAAILNGLSFTPELMALPTKRLSGGWRMRVALARALFVEPDILLLDEPTNHLDLHAVLWLEAFLQRWTRTLVVVSHSRSFLNEVCTEIIHLQNKKLEYYDGNYDMFETTRFDRLKQQQREFDAQQSQREHIMSFVNKFRASAARAKMAQSRLKMLDRMEMIAPIVSEAGVTFEFPQPDDVSGPMVQIIDCEFGYKAGQTLFRDVNFGLDSDSRVALVGANGTGKSTFMKVVLGTLEPRRGQVVRNPKIRVGHFAQHHLEQLTPQQTALEFMRTKFPEAEEGPLRAQLSAFGLSGDRALQPIYTLSGGQKSRLALAWITLNRPHLLLLDEPTNHLDIDTVTALLQALMSYKGGILVVSHDESFITSLCDQIHVAHDGKLERYHGEFEQYRQSIAKEVKI